MKAPINWSIRKETQKQQMTQKFLGEQSIVREGGGGEPEIIPLYLSP